MIVTTERPIHLQTNIWVLDVPFLAKQEQVCHVEFEIFHYQETAFVLKLKMTLEIDLFLELSMTLEIDLVLESSVTQETALFVCTADLLRCLYIPVYHSKAVPV